MGHLFWIGLLVCTSAFGMETAGAQFELMVVQDRAQNGARLAGLRDLQVGLGTTPDWLTRSTLTPAETGAPSTPGPVRLIEDYDPEKNISLSQSDGTKLNKLRDNFLTDPATTLQKFWEWNESKPHHLPYIKEKIRHCLGILGEESNRQLSEPLYRALVYKVQTFPSTSPTQEFITYLKNQLALSLGKSDLLGAEQRKILTSLLGPEGFLTFQQTQDQEFSKAEYNFRKAFKNLLRDILEALLLSKKRMDQDSPYTDRAAERPLEGHLLRGETYKQYKQGIRLRISNLKYELPAEIGDQLEEALPALFRIPQEVYKAHTAMMQLKGNEETSYRTRVSNWALKNLCGQDPIEPYKQSEPYKHLMATYQKLCQNQQTPASFAERLLDLLDTQSHTYLAPAQSRRLQTMSLNYTFTLYPLIYPYQSPTDQQSTRKFYKRYFGAYEGQDADYAYAWLKTSIEFSTSPCLENVRPTLAKLVRGVALKKAQNTLGDALLKAEDAIKQQASHDQEPAASVLSSSGGQDDQEAVRISGADV